MRATGDDEDVELAELALLLRERNALDSRLGRLIDRPVHTGSIGEWIAARIFDIELEVAANAAGFDGRFTTGDLAGRTVNVKAYTKQDRILDVNPVAPLDYYLVFTGPKGPSGPSRGSLRPFCIDAVFLFDADQLHAELVDRGVKVGVGTSVLAAQWDAAEIYPHATNPLLSLSDRQLSQLAMFSDSG